jgi:hypothetical protein
MGDDVRPAATVRGMRPWEMAEARRVFGAALDYAPIRLHEYARWPDLIDQWSRKLRRMPPSGLHTAITLGNHIFFPIDLLAAPVPPSHPEAYKISWLIHELTHVWQYQQMGWKYLWVALITQMREKSTAYDFGDEDGLKSRRKEGWTLHKFNLEQQGDIARGYYDRLGKGLDVSQYQPFIDDLRQPRSVRRARKS